MEKLPREYGAAQRLLDGLLKPGRSFDLVAKDLSVAGRRARLYFVDGFVKDEVLEKILEFLVKLTPDQLEGVDSAGEFSDRFVTYVETDPQGDPEKIVTGVLSGVPALLTEGLGEAVMIDARTYPARGVGEPEDDRVLRGAHDGFVETLVFNTALIRRRIRDPELVMELHQAGRTSRTDVVLCYLAGKADPALLRRLREKLDGVSAGALSMGQESLLECIARPQWLNPFPKVRYTERPDTAAAGAAEGSVLVLADNSPSVMILPTSVFDFVQDANDFYFPPLVGSWLRLVRMGVFLLTLFLTPAWLLLLQNPDWIPRGLEFIRLKEPGGLPVLWQLLLLEFVLDGLKLASLNTPGALSNSFGVVGALILGDFAVQAGWFAAETALYMAFVAIASFTQPSFELGYAFKLFRVLLLVFTALWNVWGFAAGLLLLVLTLAGTKTLGGKSYLYPLFPFRGKALLRLLFRLPLRRS